MAACRAILTVTENENGSVMKNGRLVIEYITHCLSSGNRDDSGDRFLRDTAGSIIWNQSWWYSALSKAIEQAGVRNIKAGHFNFDPIIAAKTDSCRRKYGGNNYRIHESILPGTRVEFNFIVPDHVTAPMVRRVMEHLGKHIGLTPFGYNLGYGKFNVIDVDIASSMDVPTAIPQ